MYISYNTVREKDTNVTLKPIIAKLKKHTLDTKNYIKIFFYVHK